MKKNSVQQRDQAATRANKGKEFAVAVLLTSDELKKKFPNLDIGNGIRNFKNWTSSSIVTTVTTGTNTDYSERGTTTSRNSGLIHKIRPKTKQASSTTTTTITISSASSTTSSSVFLSSDNERAPSRTGKYRDARNKRKTSPRVASVKASNNIAQVARTYKDEDFKPGTAGSRQAMNASKRRPQRRTDKPSNGANNTYLIDTNHMVDDSFVSFIAEIGQRLQLEDLPRDPRRLCKPFTIMIPDCDLSNSDTPPHAEDDGKLFTWKALASESTTT